jgi:hypothetical protein
MSKYRICLQVCRILKTVAVTDMPNVLDIICLIKLKKTHNICRVDVEVEGER